MVMTSDRRPSPKAWLPTKVDRGNLGAVAFVDFKGEIDATALDGNHAGGDRGVAASDRCIGVANGLHVGLNDEVVVGAELAALNDTLQGSIL